MNGMEHPAVREILPHRYPMLLVDRVLELVSGERIRAIKCVTANEPCFAEPRGGDAGAGAYPEPLLLESFLQAAGVLLLRGSAIASAPEAALLFVLLSGCRFARPVVPGDVVEHRIRLERTIPGGAIVAGVSLVEGEVAVTIEKAVLVVRPRSSLVPRGSTA